MRDPSRIPIVMDKIQEVWKSNPDFRLGQLICVFARPSQPCNDLFNIEEDDLLKGIDKFLNRLNTMDNNVKDGFWERYPKISKIPTDEITVDIIESFIKQLKLENNKITITPKNLMKLNNAPISDKNWMSKQDSRIRKIEIFLTQLEMKEIISESEVGYRYN